MNHDTLSDKFFNDTDHVNEKETGVQMDWDKFL